MDNGLANYLNVSNIKKDPIRVSIIYKYNAYSQFQNVRFYICFIMLILPGLLSIYDDLKIKRSKKKQVHYHFLHFLK